MPTLKETERMAIATAIRSTRSLSAAAKSLDIDRRTLYRMIARHGLDQVVKETRIANLKEEKEPES